MLVFKQLFTCLKRAAPLLGIVSLRGVSLMLGVVARVIKRLEKTRPIFFKVAKTVAEPKNAKMQTLF